MLDAAWGVAVAAQLFLLIFRAVPLRKHWPGWLSWLTGSSAQAGVLTITRTQGSQTVYFWAWLVTEAIVIALLVWTMFEAYQRRAERRLNVGRAGRYITVASVLVALGWYAFTAPALTWDWLLQRVLQVRGLVVMGLGTSAVIVLGLYAAFPCKTAEVVKNHHTVLTAYLTLHALEAWAVHGHYDQRWPVETVYLAGSAALFIYWAWIIGPIPDLPPPERGGEADTLDGEQRELGDTLNRSRSLTRDRDA
jgi:hypothetical protein